MPKRPDARPEKLHAELLEPRVLFSADPLFSLISSISASPSLETTPLDASFSGELLPVDPVAAAFAAALPVTESSDAIQHGLPPATEPAASSINPLKLNQQSIDLRVDPGLVELAQNDFVQNDLLQNELAAVELPEVDLARFDSFVVAPDDSHAPFEVVFVDAAVADVEDIAAAVQAESGSTHWKFFRLDAARNGVEQINQVLGQLQSIDAIHLLAHGDGGGLQLGNQILSADTAIQFTDQFASWGDALDTDADLLIYACDLASSETGQALVELIARTTGSDVAASVDLTGHSTLGADWDLEYRVGEIETNVLATAQVQQSWQHTLDITTDLVGHYAFDENGGGTLIDATGNQNGMFGNGASWTSDSVAGSHALNFSSDSAGFNAYVQVADNAAQDFGTGDWTVNLWYQLSGTPAADAHLLGDYDGTQGFSIRIDTAGDIIVTRGSSGGSSIFPVGSAITDGQWHMLSVVVEGGNLRWSQDAGAETTFGIAAINVDTVNPLRIGANSGTTDDFEGLIDEVRLYSRALTSGDIAELYAPGNTIPFAKQDTPDTQFVTQNGTLTFGAATGNALTVSDLLAATDRTVQVQLSVEHGELALSQFTGLTFIEGANDSGGFVVNGTESAINAALEGMTFTPTAGFSGSVDINMTTELFPTLEGLYTFDEGNANDQSAGTAEHGVANGNATTVANAERGEVLGLDGDADSVEVNSAYGDPQDVTLSTWVNVTGIDSGGGTYLELGGGIGIWTANFGAYNMGVQGFVGDGSSFHTIGTTENIIGTGWRHLAISHHAASMDLSFYLDGVLVSQTVTTGLVDYGTGARTLIGSHDSLNRDVTGLVDDVRIYAATLSADEIMALSQDRVSAENTVAIDVVDPLVIAATSNGGLSINEAAGNNAYLVADDGGALLGGLDSFTIETQFSSTDTGTENPLFSYNVTTDNEVLITVLASGDLNLYVNGTYHSSPVSTFDYFSLFDGQQHTLAVTWDNTNGEWEIFADGVSVDSGTGLATGATLAGAATDGTLVLGQEQDSPGGEFDASQVFAGTLHDVRVFDDVRSAQEIAASYRSTLPFDEPGMIANWRFDSLTADKVVIDVVNRNNLTLSNYAASGFTQADATLTLAVDENVQNGTVVGTVAGFDVEREQRLAALLEADTDLVYNATSNKIYKYVDGAVNRVVAFNNAAATPLNGVAGRLPIIESSHENQIIKDFVGPYGIWLGGSDSVVADEWRWDDGSLFYRGGVDGININDAYINFQATEPNGGTNTSLVYLSLQSGGLWKDSSASLLNTATVIEWDADSVLNATDGFVYSIEAESVAGVFSIDSVTGDISIADSAVLDASAQANHTITVRRTDVDGNNYDENIIVLVNDLLESSVSPSDLSSGIELHTDNGNSALLQAKDGGAILGGLTSLTFEATFQVEATRGDNVLIDYGTAVTDDAFNFAIKDYGDMFVRINDSAGSFSQHDYSQLLLDGQPHHFALVWDNTNGDVAIYIDGQWMESNSGFFTGATIDGGAGNGQLIFGQNQDSTTAVFDTEDGFEGSLYDVRIWDHARSASDIQLNYRHKFDSGSIPVGLLANWQMDGINGSNEVVDLVGSNNLSIGQATGAGFVVSTVVNDLHISENADDGDTVGFVFATNADGLRDVVSDGSFLDASPPGGGQLILAPTSGFGGWTVGDTGSVVLFNADNAHAPPGGGHVLSLDHAHASIHQTIATEAGRQYQIIFEHAGGFGDGVSDFAHTRVSAGGYAKDFTIEKPDSWNFNSNLGWETRSLTFTAAGATTDVSFQTLNETAKDSGIVGGIRILEVPAAISTILSSDSTLQYDAATGKFYRHVSTSEVWADARDAAIEARLNGVRGQLVTIDSAYENELVRTLVDGSDIWLGATDQSVNGVWRWQQGEVDTDQFWQGDESSGYAIAGYYSNWDASNPGDAPADDDYALMESDGQWIDRRSIHTGEYVIEWDASDVLGSYTYTLDDSAGGRFAIDNSSGEITLAAASLLDYEAFSSHSIDITVTDASGKSYSETVNIAVDDGLAVGQAVPAAQTTDNDTVLTFTGANAITVSDGLASANTPLQVYISTNSNGTLTLSQTTGLDIVEGSSGSTFMTIQGAEADINAALDGLIFTAASGYTGPVTLDVTTSLGADLQGRYEFESDASDTAAGMFQHGTLHSNAMIGSDGTRGEVLLLDGLNDYVEIPSLFGSPGSVTLAAWINANAVDVSGGTIVTLGSDVELRLSADGRLQLSYEDGGGFRILNDTGAALVGTGWRHVAVTIDGITAEKKLYVDGVNVASSSSPGSIVYSNESVSRIGAHADAMASYELQGSIDSVRIYDRALSGKELEALSNDATTANDSVPITVSFLNDAPSFASDDGVVSTDASGSIDEANQILMQSDGKIIAVGDNNTLGAGIVLARYNTDGTLDSTFGVGGLVSTDAQAGVEFGDAATLQTDGKIVVVGGSLNGGNYGLSLYRYNTDGSLDTSFGTAGFVFSQLSAENEGLDAVTQQADGKLLASGYQSNGVDTDMLLVRYNADGTLDSTFGGGDGVVVTAIPFTNEFATELVVQDDGKIISGGYVGSQIILTRYLADGAIDTSFGGSGIVITDIPGGVDRLEGLAVQPDGRIVAAGHSGGDFVAVRYLADGSLDSTFGGGDGIASANVLGNAWAYDMALQDDGKILVGGYDGGSASDFALVRFDATGGLDTTFGSGNGYVITDVGGDDAGAGVVVQSDGRIVMGGWSDAAGTEDFTVLRYTASGELDTTFGVEGTLGDYTPTFVEDGSAIVLDDKVQIFDAELSVLDNFAGASVSLARSGGANIEDSFGFLDANGVSYSANSLLKNASVVAAFDTSTPGQLLVTFTDANAEVPTQVDVDNVLQQITYTNTSNDPPAHVQIDWVFSDGNTGTQGSGGVLTATGSTPVAIAPVSNDVITDAHYTQYLAGSEFIVNSHTPLSQYNPDVAALPDGGFVVVWVSDDQDGDEDGVFAQRYNAAGMATGLEVQVNTETNASQNQPRVAVLADGGYVVVWDSDLQDGDRYGVFAQRFDAAGNPTGSEFQVNSTTADDQQDALVAGLPGGGFVVVWESDNQDGSEKGIYQQIYAADGAASGVEAVVNTITVGGQFDAALTSLDDGGYIVTWDDTSGGDTEVYAQRFDATGTKVGGFQQINTTAASTQENSGITALPDGKLVVVWESRQQDGDGEGIFGQLLDDSLNPIGGEFQINSSIVNHQNRPFVTALADGGFTVVWESLEQDGDDLGIFAQQYDAVGNRVNGELQINTTTAGSQQDLSLTALDDGRLVVVWDSVNQDASETAVIGRIFTPALNEHSPAGTIAAVVSQIIDDDSGDSYTYSLQDDAGGAFDINPVDGTITVLDPALLDFETTGSLDVTVRITDPVTGSHDEIVTIYLNNLIEAQQQVPGAQSVDEDSDLLFSAGNGNALTVTDTLADTDVPLQVALSVTDGVLKLAGMSGITVVDGGDGRDNIIFNGVEADINAALDGMSFVPAPDSNGAVTLNMTTSLTAKLEGHYTFNDSSAADNSTAAANDGALIGGVDTTVDATHGEVLNLDAAGEYVVIPGVFDEPASVTLAAWVHLGSAPGTYADLISLGDNVVLRLDQATGAGVQGYLYDGSSFNTVDTGEFVAGTGWRHVAFVVDANSSSGAVYIDGELLGAATLTQAVSYSVNPNTVIGAHGDESGSGQVQGLVDEARVYARALSAAEIKALATDRVEVSDTINITVNPVNDAPSFALPGELIHHEGIHGYGQANDVLVLADGSMVLTPFDSEGDSVLLKVNVDGSIATDFGNNGYADNSSLGYIHSLSEAPGGKILVSGDLAGDVTIAQFNADGTIDTGFGAGGISTLPNSTFDAGAGIAVQPDGHIVLVGEYGDDGLIARFTDTGMLDAGFATGGIATVDLGGTSNTLESVAVLADGAIIAVGHNHIVKLHGNGALDTSFDADGILNLGHPVRGITVQTDGKFVVTGGDYTSLHVYRFNSDGSVDTHFGSSGTASWAGVSAFGHAIAQQSDGKLLAAGYTEAYPVQWVAVRFETDGSLDTSFGDNGAWVQSRGIDFSEATSVAIYDTGSAEKIVLGGLTAQDGFDNNALASITRFHSDGTLDRSLVTNTLDFSSTFIEDGVAVILDNDARLYDPELSRHNGGAGNFDGASLTLNRNGGVDTNDQFGFADGNGITLTAGNLSKSGQVIATFDTTSIPGQLRITFTDASGEMPTSADVDAVLRQIHYLNNNDLPASTVQFDWVFDDGNVADQGSGGALQVSGNTSVNITSVNDAPINSLPGSQTVAEEAASSISGVSVSDVDAGSNLVATQLRVSAGVLNVVLSGAATFSAGANGTNDFTVQGSLADVNATLATLIYTGNADIVGVNADTLQMLTSDLGNSGNGGPLSDLDNVQIDITAVNDAPINTVPGAQTVAEESATPISGLVIGDIDSGANTVSTRLQVTAGVLDVTLSGAAVISAGLNTSSDLTIEGVIADINATLASLTYTGNTDIVGVNADSLTVTTNDLGNSGSGGALSDTDYLQIDITAVNDAPINTLPGTLTVPEEMPTTISGLSISDADAGSSLVSTRLQVAAGELEVTLSGAATISAGSNHSDDLTLLGTVDDINATLVSLAYTGNTDIVGVNADTLAVTTNDFGNTGSGGVQANTGFVQIDIAAINDSPVNSLPGPVTVDEETPTAITGIAIADVDAGTSPVTARLQVSAGVLDVTLAGTAAFSAGTGNSNDFTLLGSLTDINASLATLIYTANTDVVGVNADALTLTTNDLGNTGSGGGQSASGTVQVNINSVNDAPLNTVPGSQAVAEETPTLISGISIMDVDAASNPVSTRLSVNSGALDVTLAGTASISAGANHSNDLTLLGSLIDINATLTTLTYTGNMDVVGVNADTLLVSTSDLGSTGSGGVLSDVDSLQIDITAINDTPVISVPASVPGVSEQNNLNLHGLGFNVADADAAGALITATLTVGEGAITLSAGDSGVTVQTNGASSVSFSGTLSQINALLNGSGTGTVVYHNDSDTPSATTQIVLTVNDAGNTGVDPGLTGDATSEEQSAVQTITINAVNDPPYNSGALPVDVAVTEDVLSTIDLSSVHFNDPDAGANPLTVTLATTNGGQLSASASGSGVVPGGTSTALTLTGSLVDLNTYFDSTSNIRYLHGSADTYGNDVDTLTMEISDHGYTGAGGTRLQLLGSVNVDIAAVNDAPFVGVPSHVGAVEETATAVDGISIGDLDAGVNPLTVRLQVSAGVLDIELSGAAAITSGASNSNDLTLQGSLSDLNASLASTTYTGNVDVVGVNADTLTLTTSDLGNSGIGGSLNTVASVPISLAAVNDRPVVSGPAAAYSVHEQTDLQLHGTGFGVADIDAGSGVLTAALTVGEGSIEIVAGDSGVTITANNASSVAFSGTLSQINALLEASGAGTVIYHNHSDNPSASTGITLTINDAGHTGTDPGSSADSQSESSSVTQSINIIAVNDNPYNSTPLPEALSVTEDVASNLDLSWLNIGDADAAGEFVSVTLTTLTGGQLSAAATEAVSVSGGATDLTFTGTLTDLNSYFTVPGSVQYLHGLPNLGGDNIDSLSISVIDHGHTGIGGGGEQLLGVVAINADGVNDAPVITVPGAQSLTQQAPGAIGGIFITDADSGEVSTRLQVGAGALNILLSGSATIIAGSNNTGDITLQGSIADINTTLASLSYTSYTGVAGSNADVLTVTTLDLNADDGAAAQPVVNTISINIVSAAEQFEPSLGAAAPGVDTGLAGSMLHEWIIAPETQSFSNEPAITDTAVVTESLTIVETENEIVLQSESVTASLEPGNEILLLGSVPDVVSKPVVDYQIFQPVDAPVVRGDSGADVDTEGETGLFSEDRLASVLSLAPAKLELFQLTDDMWLYDHPGFGRSIEKMQGDLNDAADKDSGMTVFTQTVVGVSITISTGFLIWLLRGSALVASLLATTPIWRQFDPLVILSDKDDEREDEFSNERVERIFEKSQKKSEE